MKKVLIKKDVVHQLVKEVLDNSGISEEQLFDRPVVINEPMVSDDLPVAIDDDIESFIPFQDPPVYDEEYVPVNVEELGRAMMTLGKSVPSDKIEKIYRDVKQAMAKEIDLEEDSLGLTADGGDKGVVKRELKVQSIDESVNEASDDEKETPAPVKLPAVPKTKAQARSWGGSQSQLPGKPVPKPSATPAPVDLPDVPATKESMPIDDWWRRMARGEYTKGEETLADIGKSLDPPISPQGVKNMMYRIKVKSDFFNELGEKGVAELIDDAIDDYINILKGSSELEDEEIDMLYANEDLVAELPGFRDYFNDVVKKELKKRGSGVTKRDRDAAAERRKQARARFQGK